MSSPILIKNERGLYCPAGKFYVDPWAPVERAIITHAHGDHARPGSASYLCAAPGKLPLQLRVDAKIETLAYGEKRKIGNTVVSFHPAGHILGSSQIRVEAKGEVWVVSGDYKRTSDPTCDPFEPVRCHTFITESTFALPVYRWQETDTVIQQIIDWWTHNVSEGKPSILLCYVLGKSQRLLSLLKGREVGPIYAHGALQAMNLAYRESGVPLPSAPNPLDLQKNEDYTRALIFAPPSVMGTSWLRRFRNCSVGRVSGWMRVRGRRRRQALDRGFILSDHGDWPSLLQTIKDSGAGKVLTTHGYGEVLTRYLQENGWISEYLPLSPWESEDGQ